jgi:hypothetical protein
VYKQREHTSVTDLPFIYQALGGADATGFAYQSTNRPHRPVYGWRTDMYTETSVEFGAATATAVLGAHVRFPLLDVFTRVKMNAKAALTMPVDFASLDPSLGTEQDADYIYDPPATRRTALFALSEPGFLKAMFPLFRLTLDSRRRRRRLLSTGSSTDLSTDAAADRVSKAADNDNDNIEDNAATRKLLAAFPFNTEALSDGVRKAAAPRKTNDGSLIAETYLSNFVRSARLPCSRGAFSCNPSFFFRSQILSSYC